MKIAAKKEELTAQIPRMTLNYRIFALIILCCLGVVIYSNTFQSSFHFDDEDSIIKNISIRNLNN